MPPPPKQRQRPPRLWSDLPRRLLTVSLGAPLVVAVLSRPATSRLFFHCVHLLCCVEWMRLVPDGGADGARERGAAELPLPLRLFPVLSLALSLMPTRRLPPGLCLAAALLHLSCPAADAASARTAGRHCLHGLLYLTVPFHHLGLISSASFAHTVWLLFVVWNGDTGALVSGRAGRMLAGAAGDPLAALFPRQVVGAVRRISPSKSMTGLVGGLAFAALTAAYGPAVLRGFGSLLPRLCGVGAGGTPPDYYAVDPLDFGNLPGGGFLHGVPPRRAAVGIVLGTAAFLGDLVESSVKRASGRKDSGRLLPGHGGILDRFDSVLLAAVVYWHWCVTDA